MIKNSLQSQASRLAQLQLAGTPPSSKELAQVARSLNVEVKDLRAAMENALQGAVKKNEAAGQNSAQLRADTAGGERYANENVVDLKSTSVLGGHNLAVDLKAAKGVQAQNASVQETKAVAQINAKAALNSVPNVGDLEALKVGAKSADDVAAALKTALLSDNPKVVKKAAETLRTAESYQRKAAEDKSNYAGTGFWKMSFPTLNLRLNEAETRKLVNSIGLGRDPEVAGAMMLASSVGMISTEPANALHDHKQLREMWPAGKNARLPSSEGAEQSGRDTFREEYTKDVAPGERTIESVIVETAKANGPSCPFAQGNHAKGVSFGDGEFKVDKGAPDWARELVGNDPKQGAMMRISTSATNPEDHDKEPAQTGVRLVIPILGKAGQDGSSTWDITANTGSSTHRPNPREHTDFTNELSVPRSGLAGTQPVRLAKYLFGGVKNFNLLDRAKGIGKALAPTKEAGSKPFHKQNLFARHTLFMGGRYVQCRYKVIDPTDFGLADPKAKNGQLDVKEDGIARSGIKIRIYMTELPEGADPSIVEKEGWEKGDFKPGQELKEFVFGEVSFDPQKSDPDSEASKFFEKYAHVPGRQSQIARGVGQIGRGRSPVYQASETQRHKQR